MKEGYKGERASTRQQKKESKTRKDQQFELKNERQKAAENIILRAHTFRARDII